MISMQKIYWSHKSRTSYACVAIGEDYAHTVVEQHEKRFVNVRRTTPCQPDEVVLLEIKSFGKPVVIKKNAFLEAIEKGIIEVREN